MKHKLSTNGDGARKPDGLISTREFCEEFGLSLWVVRGLVHRRKLKPFMANKRTWLWHVPTAKKQMGFE